MRLRREKDLRKTRCSRSRTVFRAPDASGARQHSSCQPTWSSAEHACNPMHPVSVCAVRVAPHAESTVHLHHVHPPAAESETCERSSPQPIQWRVSELRSTPFPRDACPELAPASWQGCLSLCALHHRLCWADSGSRSHTHSSRRRSQVAWPWSFTRRAHLSSQLGSWRITDS